jgi:hypothetical protein
MGYPSYGVTVKTPLLVLDPPAVVMVMFPVSAPAGTVAVTWMSLSTVKLADTEPNVTRVA